MMSQKINYIGSIVIAAAFAGVMFLGAFTAFAQSSSFTPPFGFLQDYSRPGIYYNPFSMQFYNPMTGQYTTVGPVGEAGKNTDGSYVIPSNYTRYGSTSYYHNSSTGYYYDPMTGFSSTQAPINTGVTLDMARNYTAGTTGGGTVITPGVPNTGFGDDAAKSFAILAVTALAAIGGSLYISRRVLRV